MWLGSLWHGLDQLSLFKFSFMLFIFLTINYSPLILTTHWLCFTVHSVHYVKRGGSVLDQGSVVAKLDLDDPSRVHRVSLEQFIHKHPTNWARRHTSIKLAISKLLSFYFRPNLTHVFQVKKWVGQSDHSQIDLKITPTKLWFLYCLILYALRSHVFYLIGMIEIFICICKMCCIVL